MMKTRTAAVTTFALALAVVGTLSAAPSTGPLHGRRVAALVADGFHPAETPQPIAHLEKLGAEVIVVGIEPGTVSAAFGPLKLDIEKRARDVSMDGIDGVFIPGGTSPAKLRKDEGVLDFVRRAVEADKTVAAICHGPQVLISAGVLEDRQATCVVVEERKYYDVRDEITEAGGTYVNRAVVIDGNIVTSRLPGDVPQFQDAFAKMLAGAYDYELTCEHLVEPERLLPYVTKVADYWSEALDEEHGGCFTNVERDGTPKNTNKGTLAQSRAVYGAVRAFQVSGDERYLDQAERVLRFLYEHAWDEEHGGWFAQVDREGNVLGGRDQAHSAFVEHYALVGIAAMVEATRAAEHEDWLQRAREANDRLWDEREEVDGYYDSASRDWSRRSGKGFTAEGDAITAHLLADYLTGRAPDRRARLRAVADNLVEHFVGNMDAEGVAALFPYAYDSDWNIDRDVTELDIGHLLKTAWHLQRAYLVFGDERYRQASARIMERFRTHERGTENALWDDETGIPRGRARWASGKVYQPSGAWWTLEQAVTAGLLAWHTGFRTADIEVADRTMRFFLEHYWDDEHGEAFVHVAPDGKVLTDRKGWGFHTAELMYCAYLYSSLFYHHQPVTLHYRFEPAEKERRIKLTPLAIPDEALTIKAVQLDGKPYESFKPRSRTLHLKPGVGGVFRVTFK
ncbi:MAG: DJ-1/PfpI family protein [Planctomycetota bacterium]